MSAEGPGLPPAGWYWDGAAYRWWDGRAWGLVAPAGLTPAGSGGSPRPERGLGVLAHVLVIVAGFLGPLIMLVALDPNRPYERRHAREALNFSLTVLVVVFGAIAVVLVVMVALMLVLATTVGEAAFGLSFLVWGVMMVVMMVVSFAPLIFGILAAVRTWQGDDYRYPICIRFVPDPPEELAALGIATDQ